MSFLTRIKHYTAQSVLLVSIPISFLGVAFSRVGSRLVIKSVNLHIKYKTVLGEAWSASLKKEPKLPAKPISQSDSRIFDIITGGKNSGKSKRQL